MMKVFVFVQGYVVAGALVYSVRELRRNWKGARSIVDRSTHSTLSEAEHSLGTVRS